MCPATLLKIAHLPSKLFDSILAHGHKDMYKSEFAASCLQNFEASKRTG